MSSFVNDNVSESKQQEQKIVTENQENSSEITTGLTIATKNNQLENEATTATIAGNNDNNVKSKLNEKNIENTAKTIKENKSEQSENSLEKTTIEAEAAAAAATTVSNNDSNEINNDAVIVVCDKNKDDGAAIDNNQNLNKTDDNKPIIAQISTSPGAGVLSAAPCSVSIMTPGDVEQLQKQQQVASSYDNQQTTAIPTTTSKTSNEETATVPPILTTSLLFVKDDKSEANNRDTTECYVKTASPTTLHSTATITKLTETSPLPPLPPGLASSLSSSHLPHISSDPTFGVKLRNRNSEQQQQNKTNNNNPTRPTTSGESSFSSDWRTNTSGPNISCIVESGTASASASPSMVRKASDSSILLPRRVSFPKSDNELVTGYLEPANPWEHVYLVKSISEIAELYIASCQKHNTQPLQSILDHLKAVDLTKQLKRQPLLSLKSIKLAPSDCEALEEVLKRVQYKTIDLSDCKLDETAASALFDMIEYYEATNELDISSNAMGMTHRGWTSCIYMISHSQELQVLNAEGNPISKLSADHLGNALCTSNLHTLKLEHCGLKGAPLSGLCFKLWQNKVLKELWLAHNDLDCNDADTIAEMLKCNHYLELIDISNNNIRDEGLWHIVRALIMQSKELERRTTFQRTAAIDDDSDCTSPVESSPPAKFPDKNDDTSLDWKAKEQEEIETQSLKVSSKCDNLGDEISMYRESPSLPSIEEKVKEVDVETGRAVSAECEHHKVKPPLISSVGSTIDENDGDEDTDDTVRSSTVRNPLQNASAGQSMLDKLLSMNSESSSEEGASNLSTDTIAACNSEEPSLISDDIFDSTVTTTTTTSTNTKAPTNTGLELTSLSEGEETVTSAIVIRSATTTAPPKEHIERKEETTNLRSSPLERMIIEHNKVKSHDTNLVSVSSASNLSKAINVQSSHMISDNNINNNPATKTINLQLTATQTSSVPASSNDTEDPNNARSGVYEVTAEDSDCLLSSDVSRVAVSEDVEIRQGEHVNVMQHHSSSRALDVNKNTKLAEDFDDTHSTDSAFESASEGDISRHLPEEFTRLSTSLESSRFDDIAKELAIETATIASESNECLIAAAAQVTPSSTPIPPTSVFSNLSTPLTERERLSAESPINSCLSSSLPTATTTPPTVKVDFAVLEEPTESPVVSAVEVRDKMPKVTIAQDSFTQKYKSNSAICTNPSPIPTPPPPSTSPGGASSGLRRTESSCGFLTQSSRNRSQSTDSLCSDNSLDGSIGSGDLNFSTSSHLNDKVTKNDTLTRQQRPAEAMTESCIRVPGGLKALIVWNNNLTKQSGHYISDLLVETTSLELLNIGKNCLSNDFISTIKDSLTKNTTVTNLGLQSAHLSAKGIETLSSILTFGGNSTLQRIDIRDNKLEVESLTKIAEVLKSNTTVTQIDIDDEPKRLSVGSEAHLDYARVLENVRSMCSRNEKTQAQIQQEKSTANAMSKKRGGGYYLGSRKISLTCHSRPVADTSQNVATNSKLDIKRKAGTRLRSPVPSPTTISPSSSPNRTSRFQVFRVSESTPLPSPSTQKPIAGNLIATRAISMSIASLPLPSASDKVCIDPIYPNITSTSLPTSSSLPSMATISSSTQSVKRLSVSPRSRFLVRKVYEDPNLSLSSRFTQSITPPINPPPTPLSRNAETPVTECLDTIQSCKLTNNFRQEHITGSRTAEVVALPTIVTPQQLSATTDNTSTPVSKLSQDTITIEEETQKSISTSTTIIAKQCEQGTNETITNDNNIANQTQTMTTTIQTALTTPLSTTVITVPKSSTHLQPSPHILSTFSALSSSSDSTSSSSSSPSSSSSSSTSPASNTDSSDSPSSPAYSVHSNEALGQEQHDLTVSGPCPIAALSDNDITLTNNTVNEVFGPDAVAASSVISKENVDESPNTALQPENQQQRVRKISWISNPTAVDKLLTLFHNSATIFQRSSSPETKSGTASTSTTPEIQLSQSPPIFAEAAPAAVLIAQQPKSQTSLVPTRKQSPPSWTKLGNDIITAAATNKVDLANTVATTAAAAVTEQSRSFFDAASKQFRDISKQVFRQNLSFGNEPVTTSSGSSNIMTTVSALNAQTTASENAGRTGEHCTCGCIGTTNVCLCGNILITECNADCLPTDVKQEIKENISPEHTINEETLHTMQKLYGSASAALPSAITTTLATNLNADDENRGVSSTNRSSMFSVFPAAGTTGAAGSIVVSATSPTPIQTTQIQQQQSTVAETSNIESELQAHNT